MSKHASYADDRELDAVPTSNLLDIYYWYSAGFTVCLCGRSDRCFHVRINRHLGAFRHRIGHPNIIGGPTEFLLVLYNTWTDTDDHGNPL